MKHIFRTVLILTLVAVTAIAGTSVALAAGPAQELQIKGTISDIANAATPPTVTITPKEGAAVTVKIDDKTKITKAGVGQATVADLAKGDRATAEYDKDTLVASRIQASKPISKHHAYTGTIKSTSATGLVITTKKGEVTIDVNAQTRYKVPGLKDATLANFKTGNKVAVLAVESGTASLALHVILIPGKPTSVQRVGTIEAYEAGKSITIKDKKGDTSTFVVNADTKISFKKGATEVKVGARATVTAKRDPATDQFTAKNMLVFGTKESK
ncbi:MAG: hypothetical protein HYX87_08140 [Chloroflexi bacterium]|nr:hypothetical protein [Chloroflexota bacterium]